MNSYIADANVIFSGLLSGKQSYLDLVRQNRIYLPDYALTELQQYQNVIWEKTKQSPDELKEYALELFASILVVPNMLISTRSHLAAFQLCKNIDTDDVVYVALAIEFDYPLLTRDKPLAAGLRANAFTNIILLDELIG